MYSINIKDVAKGIIAAVFSAVAIAILSSLYQLVQTPGFDVFAANWHVIISTDISLAINVAIGAFTGYLGKNFFSDNQGKFAGKIG